jgi:hypothetical protein
MQPRQAFGVLLILIGSALSVVGIGLLRLGLHL